MVPDEKFGVFLSQKTKFFGLLPFIVGATEDEA
jgi:hypothetical protein